MFDKQTCYIDVFIADDSYVRKFWKYLTAFRCDYFKIVPGAGQYERRERQETSETVPAANKIH